MGCPFLGAFTPDVAKEVLRDGLNGWHNDEPDWLELKNKILLAAAVAAPAMPAAAADVGPDGLTGAQRNTDHPTQT